MRNETANQPLRAVIWGRGGKQSERRGQECNFCPHSVTLTGRKGTHASPA